MFTVEETAFENKHLSLKDKFFNISYSYLLMILLLGFIGIGMLYSAGEISFRHGKN